MAQIVAIQRNMLTNTRSIMCRTTGGRRDGLV